MAKRDTAKSKKTRTKYAGLVSEELSRETRLVAEADDLYNKGMEMAVRQPDSEKFVTMLRKIRNADIKYRGNGCYMSEELIRITK